MTAAEDGLTSLEFTADFPREESFATLILHQRASGTILEMCEQAADFYHQ